MIRHTSAFIFLFAVFSNIGAQTDFMDRGGQTALNKRHFQINAGTGYTNWGLPIYAGVEYAFNEDITLGGFASYSTYDEGILSVKFRHEVFSVFTSANMHVNRLLKFDEHVDLYAGVSAGFNSYNTKVKDKANSSVAYTGTKSSGLLITVQAGARYYFTKNLGVQGELIVGSLNGFHAGLTYRIQ